MTDQGLECRAAVLARKHAEALHSPQHHAEIVRLPPGYIPAKTRESVGKPRREVSHYVVPGGPFALACAELVKSGFAVRYVELWSDEQTPITKYICPACGLGAWGKPAINLVCGSCNEPMEGEETNREGESGS